MSFIGVFLLMLDRGRFFSDTTTARTVAAGVLSRRYFFTRGQRDSDNDWNA
jgi:hypothetical protein